MQKVINPVKQISVQESITKLFESTTAIMYYRSKNDMNAVPAFLKLVENPRKNVGDPKYIAHFVSPVFGRKPSFQGYGDSKNAALESCLNRIGNTRTVYFCEDHTEIFKVQKEV